MKIEVRLNTRQFLQFSWFDLLRHRKGWRAPALFAAILCACAAVCFVMRGTRGAVLLGVVLVIAGIGVPAAYFLSYFLSLRAQAQKEELAQPKYVYTLELGDGGITVNNGREQAVYPWSQVFRAYRRRNAAYLYLSPQQAFLIPYECVKGGEEALWRLLVHCVPQQRQSAA